MDYLWCNGQWLDSAKYPGSSQDRGAFLGLGLFETMAAVDGRPVFAGRHLARLKKSCERLGWPLDLPDFESVAAELLERNSLSTGLARMRLVVTAGSGPHNDLSPGADRLLWVSAFRVTEIPASITLCLSPWPRNERSPLVGLKTACYAENLVALDHAKKQGFGETLFLNTVGQVCETATANIFLVKDRVLLTPSLDSGCLPGIGREVLLEIATAQGIPCEVRSLTQEDVLTADEIFISSSTRGPVAVTKFEERILHSGQVTDILRKYWRDAADC